MAHMIFPPGNWNQTVNTIDTIVLDYTSTYPGVNLTLFCETVKGTGDWIWWYLPGPLTANGSYNLHLTDFNFVDSVNVWPTRCHFDLVNSKNEKQAVNGGNIPLSTQSGAAEKTWSLSGSSTSIQGVTSASTLSSPTRVSSGSSSSATAGTSGTTSATSDSNTSGLSEKARVSIGVGVGIGGALILILAASGILTYRKRRQASSARPRQADDVSRYEKAELLGTSVMPQNELPSSTASSVHPDAVKQPQVDQQLRWSAHQEITTSATLRHEMDVTQRFELAS